MAVNVLRVFSVRIIYKRARNNVGIFSEITRRVSHSYVWSFFDILLPTTIFLRRRRFEKYVQRAHGYLVHGTS